MADRITLNLNSLFSGRIGLTSSEGGHLAECAVVCYDRCGYHTLPELHVTGRHELSFTLAGPPTTNQMRRAYADLQEATEYGACAVAVLIMEACEGLTIYERASKGGGGFDYYLTPLAEESDTDNFLGEATAALEVSGILEGTIVDLQYRLNEKRRQLQDKPQLLPVFIVVVAFRASTVRIEQQ
jgi:hypothetical protein